MATQSIPDPKKTWEESRKSSMPTKTKIQIIFKSVSFFLKIKPRKISKKKKKSFKRTPQGDDGKPNFTPLFGKSIRGWAS